jgi:molybdate transport system permease protein
LIVTLGTPLALRVARRPSRSHAALSTILMLPLVLPPTVVGYGLLLLLGRRGPIGGILQATLGWTPVFHWTGAVIAATVAAFPLFWLPARAAFAAVDPGLEDAARLLGRNESSVFASVTVPLALPGLAAGAVLAFARALGDFGATLMVAGDIPGRTRTASLAIYDAAVHRNDPATAWVLATLVSALALVALAVTGGFRLASAGARS